MTNTVTAFCYAALSKCPERIPDLLPLLTPGRRADVEAVLNNLAELSKDKIHAEWEQLRRTEMGVQRRNLIERLGPEAAEFSPRLRFWLTRPF